MTPETQTEPRESAAARRRTWASRLQGCVAGPLLAAALHAQTQHVAPQVTPVREQVSVTTSRSSANVGEVAATVETLTAAQLQDLPALTLDESLRQHAGFELFRRSSSRVQNPTSAGISLRGLGSTAASRTLVLEDGAPLNDPFGGWIHWGEAPQDAVRAVTLVSGGGSDLYGSSALGGVIDVVPATPAPSRFVLSATGGSQSTYRLASTAARSMRVTDALLAAESMRTAGYVAVDPALRGAVDTPSNVLSQAYRAELGRRDHATRRLWVTGNILNEARSNGTPLQTNGTRLWRYLGGVDSPEFHGATGRVRAFGADESYRQSFSAIAADRSSENLTRQQRLRSQEVGATADASIHRQHVAFVTGGDVRDIRGSDDETPILRGAANGFANVSARQRFVGGFAEVLAERGRWSGTASLRADRVLNLDTVQSTATSRSTPADRTEVVLSPRIGVVRDCGAHVTLHASAFRAFRTPTMNELYRTGQVGAEITLANAALLSERATGWEAGTQIALAHGLPATFRATYFWTEINRPVSAVLVAQSASTVMNQRQNLGQIRSRGIEVHGEIHPLRAFSVDVGYQFADATITRFEAQPSLVRNRIPEVPRHALAAQLRYADARAGEMTLSARSSSKLFDDSGNQFPLAGFYAVDVAGRHAITSRLEATLLIENVTNQRAQVARTPVLTLGSGIFVQAGVRFAVGAARP